MERQFLMIQRYSPYRLNQCGGDVIDLITPDQNGEFVRWSDVADMLKSIREKIDTIAVTEGTDAGVILLSANGGCHIENIGGQNRTVYNHENFSPLGDALGELAEMIRAQVKP